MISCVCLKRPDAYWYTCFMLIYLIFKPEFLFQAWSLAHLLSTRSYSTIFTIFHNYSQFFCNFLQLFTIFIIFNSISLFLLFISTSLFIMAPNGIDMLLLAAKFLDEIDMPVNASTKFISQPDDKVSTPQQPNTMFFSSFCQTDCFDQDSTELQLFMDQLLSNFGNSLDDVPHALKTSTPILATNTDHGASHRKPVRRSLFAELSSILNESSMPGASLNAEKSKANLFDMLAHPTVVAFIASELQQLKNKRNSTSYVHH